MPTPGEQLVDELREDLSCPACGYNLRGLRGPTVACPECGARFDLANLIARRWRGPWNRAPGLIYLLLPTLVAALVVFAILIALVYDDSAGSGLPRTTVAALVGAALWGVSLAKAARSFGSARGAALSLLAHVLLLGYLAGFYGLLAAVIYALVSPTAFDKFTAGLLAVTLAGALYLCRRGERYIAEQCIRRYLSRAAAPATEPA